jgi:hypothetical protein
MKNTNVVHLGTVREMLAELDKMRAGILAGTVSGIQTSSRSSAGKDTVFLGGVFKEDPGAAMRVIIRATARADEGAQPAPKVKQR